MASETSTVEAFACKCETFFKECNGGGPITIQQLNDTLKKVNSNFNMSDKELAAIFTEIDTDNSKTISWEEFSTALTKRNPKEVQEAELKSLFQAKDNDNSGKLDKAEVKQMCIDSGMKWNEETLDRILNDGDKDGDGKIDFSEFLAQWKAC